MISALALSSWSIFLGSSVILVPASLEVREVHYQDGIRSRSSPGSSSDRYFWHLLLSTIFPLAFSSSLSRIIILICKPTKTRTRNFQLHPVLCWNAIGIYYITWFTKPSTFLKVSKSDTCKAIVTWESYCLGNSHFKRWVFDAGHWFIKGVGTLCAWGADKGTTSVVGL